MINAFADGAILALGLILPLGVQNVFVFNQGATQKYFLRAMPSVITAFMCDAVLILCAVLGISVVVFTMPLLKTFIFAIGILFLLYMGLITWKSQTGLKINKQPYSVKQQIGFTFSVSLLNPHALLDTIGVIGTNSLNFSGANKLFYTLACITVSFCWFLSLSIAGHYLNRIDNSGVSIKIINKLSALIMWLMAGFLSWQLETMLW